MQYMHFHKPIEEKSDVTDAVGGKSRSLSVLSTIDSTWVIVLPPLLVPRFVAVVNCQDALCVVL